MPMDEVSKVVLSKTLTRANWWGQPLRSRSTGLRSVDEYRLVHQPMALGEGLPLFAGLTAPLVLDLMEAQTYADGSVFHVYRPAAL